MPKTRFELVHDEDSLSYGVPVVAILIAFEQPGTGARIRALRVKEVLYLQKLSYEV